MFGFALSNQLLLLLKGNTELNTEQAVVISSVAFSNLSTMIPNFPRNYFHNLDLLLLCRFFSNCGFDSLARKTNFKALYNLI